MDHPGSWLSKYTILLMANAVALKKPTDRNLKAFANFQISSLTSLCVQGYPRRYPCGPNVTSMGLWSGHLAEEVVVLVSPITYAVKYLCTAFLESAKCSFQAAGNIVPIHRFLWLKTWSTVTASKKSLAGLPFTSTCLSGSKLDEIIFKDTGSKNFSSPSSSPWNIARSLFPFGPFCHFLVGSPSHSFLETYGAFS